MDKEKEPHKNEVHADVIRGIDPCENCYDRIRSIDTDALLLILSAFSVGFSFATLLFSIFK